MDTRLVACGKTLFAGGKGHSPVPLTAAPTYVQQAHSPNDILSLGSFFSSLRSRLLSDWEAYGGITGTRSSLRYFLRKALGLLACAVEGRYLNITSAALTHSRTHAHMHTRTHTHAHTHTHTHTLYGGSPVKHWYSTVPTLHRSARLSYLWPRSTSGAWGRRWGGGARDHSVQQLTLV